MTPQEFVAKWRKSTLTERSACQQHFLDLCDVLGQPKPAAVDPDGDWFTFEKGLTKAGGGHGFADVWMRGRFGWEYKKKRADLAAAFKQLALYASDLENPPLLVVCDMDRFEVHTNFTGKPKQVHAFDLSDLAEPKNLDVLRAVFTNPRKLEPGVTSRQITENAAKEFGKLSDGLRDRGIPAEEAAHFLMKLMFCMFADDIGLLRNKVFTKLLDAAKKSREKLSDWLRELFEAMTKGGYFWGEEVLHFNGGLFDDAHVVDLTEDELNTLVRVNAFDWDAVEPSIFGTLFERTLDPGKRAQIGAHYTSREDIETLLEPVMMTPLRREWEEVQAKCEELAERAAKAKTAATKRKHRQARERALIDFVERLAHVTVLDPACGSGNFLYVALHLLLDLEKEVIAEAAKQEVGLLPQVNPTQLAGIEINPYAQQLAQVVIWIGYLQWMHDNGFKPPSDPVLQPIENIENRDAILDLTNPDAPLEPEWPEAEFIVGNPPFLGGKRLLGELGDEYVGRMRDLWDARLPRFSDLCCFWFEKARAQIERGRTKRAGLLATQGIRGGANRTVLDRIAESGEVFWGYSDRDWVLDGATVHVAMVGFDDGTEHTRFLNGAEVATINSDLTAGTDVTAAQVLTENSGQGFIGVQKSGAFDLSDDEAQALAMQPCLDGKCVSDVLRVYWTAIDAVRRPQHQWIIDFVRRSENEASLYEPAFERLRECVPETRTAKHFKDYPFWQLWRPRPEMYGAIDGLARLIVTPHVAKHRIFRWADPVVCPSNLLIAFASDEDLTFGVLHSRVHEAWSRAKGTQLRERESGFRYTPTTCFETFSFPEASEEQRGRIGEAAAELDRLRENWLNPPEWTRTEILEFPGSTDGPWARWIDDADPHTGLGTVRYPRTVPKDDEYAKLLKKRTLTNLYNERPTWLDLAHRRLDEAVFDAYGWDPDIGDEELLANLLALNLARAAAE